MNLGELAGLLDGELVAGDSGSEYSGFALDSREVVPGSVFIAVVGANADGHGFVPVAQEKGAVCSVVTRAVDGPHILVPDLVEALALAGGRLRARFQGPVIGITGSNGKTSTKELLAAALATQGPVLKSQGNRNTELTSPLVWFERTPDMWAAVVEMGMRGFGQIAHLASVARPTIGIVTVVGTAHAEMVGSRAGIAAAKAELIEALPKDGAAIVWREDDFFAELCSYATCEVSTFGFSHEADMGIVGYRPVGWESCEVVLKWRNEMATATVPAIGRPQALNAAAAVLAAVLAGVPFTQAVTGLADAELPPLRMEVRDRKGVTVLLDTYNASPDSTVAALRALYDGPTTGKRLAVIGEMKELGDFTESGHRLVGAEMDAAVLDRVLLVGAPTRFARDEALAAGFPSSRMVQVDEVDLGLVGQFLDSAVAGDVVLVKGSRALGLERAL